MRAGDDNAGQGAILERVDSEASSSEGEESGWTFVSKTQVGVEL